jgi:AraC family transcriptional regulator of adaptative response/methylated-DNA-[protein]-cysteine methyltransferase
MRDSDEQRWDQVRRRDPSADGQFVYAVKTTGIYCRPTCSSRLPNRQNVTFFADSARAELAGFRACLKCRPATAHDSSSARQRAIVRACRLIDCSDKSPALSELAAAAGLSSFHFHRVFKEVVGMTPKAYASSVKSNDFRRKLAESPTVSEAINASGLSASLHKSKTIARTLGMKPSEYRNRGAGQEIRFAIARCRLGWTLVAATDRGICMIELGDSAEALRDRLQLKFGKATLNEAGPELDELVARVVAMIDTPSRTPDLPLDIQGTAFQRRVWDALRAIPSGSTLSYSEVARKIGAPKSTRAVARACASNSIAIAIPCHRVVRNDGSLSGFRWGIEKKRELLDSEAATLPALANTSSNTCADE